MFAAKPPAGATEEGQKTSATSCSFRASFKFVELASLCKSGGKPPHSTLRRQVSMECGSLLPLCNARGSQTFKLDSTESLPR
jgi:hypothetical protein